VSSLPYLSTKGFTVWLAGHGAHRAKARDLFERLAEGIAGESGKGEGWASIRDIVNGRRAASEQTGAGRRRK
jgi:hypothetical protein